MLGAQDLSITLQVKANTAQGKAALGALGAMIGQELPKQAGKAKESISALKIAMGQLIADGVRAATREIGRFAKASVKEFTGFEEVMTGVQKTTGLTDEAIAALGEDLQEIARDIGPITAQSIGEIAEVAGQLGIASEKIQIGNFAAANEEIAAFSTVIAKAAIALPEFTGGAAELATIISKQIGLYRANSSAAEAYLSTMNELANTTEANAAQIAGFLEGFTMAPQLQIAQDQAAAIGATFIGLSQDAHDASTRFQAALIKLITSESDTLSALVESSGDAFDQILGRARGAGESYLDFFKQALAKDAPQAIIALLDQLDRIDDSVARNQASFEIFGQIGMRAMNTLIGNTEKLRTNLERASIAAAKATSIQEEFEVAIKRHGAAFAELDSKISAVKYRIGAGLVPALADLIRTDLSPMLDDFNDWLKYSEEAAFLFNQTLPGAIKFTGQAIKALGAGLVSLHNTTIDLATKIGWYIGQQRSLMERYQDYVDFYFDTQVRIWNFWGTTVKEGPGRAIQELKADLKTFREELGQVNDAFEQEAAAVKATTAAFEDMDRTMPTVFTSLKNNIEAVYAKNADLIDSNDHLHQSYVELQRALRIGQECYITLQQAEEEAKNKNIELTEYLSEDTLTVLNKWKTHLKDAEQQYKTLESEITQITGTQKAYIPAIKDTTDALKEGADALQEYTEEAKAFTRSGLMSWWEDAAIHAQKQAELQRLSYEAFARTRAEISQWSETQGEAGIVVVDVTKDIKSEAEALRSLDNLLQESAGLTGALGVQFHALGDILGMKEFNQIGAIFSQISQFAQLPAIINDVTNALGGLGSILGGLGGILGGLTTGALGALVPIGLIGGAIAGITQIFRDHKSEGNKAAASFREFVAENVVGGAELSAAMRSMYGEMKAAGFDYATFTMRTGETISQALGGFSEAGTTGMDRLSKAIGQATGNMEKAPQVALQTVAAMQEMGLGVEEIALKLGEMTAEATGANVVTEQMAFIQDMLANSTELSAEEIAALEATFRELQTSAEAGDLQTQQLGEGLQETSKTVQKAQDDFTLLAREIEKLPAKKRIEIEIVQKGSIPSLASGGRFSGGMALVGERGPEGAQFPGGAKAIVGLRGPEIGVFPADTQIFSNSQLSAFLKSIPRLAGGGTVRATPIFNFTITGNTIDRGVDLGELADQLSDQIAEKVRPYLR